jgi:hypothetical protein
MADIDMDVDMDIDLGLDPEIAQREAEAMKSVRQPVAIVQHTLNLSRKPALPRSILKITPQPLLPTTSTISPRQRSTFAVWIISPPTTSDCSPASTIR